MRAATVSDHDTPGGQFFAAVVSAREMFRAVVEVYDRTGAEGGQPGSDRWLKSDRFASLAFDRVCIRWAELTGMEDWQMPFSRDAVKDAWVTYRKASSKHDGEIRRWAGLDAEPQQPQLFEHVG